LREADIGRIATPSQKKSQDPIGTEKPGWVVCAGLGQRKRERRREGGRKGGREEGRKEGRKKRKERRVGGSEGVREGKKREFSNSIIHFTFISWTSPVREGLPTPFSVLNTEPRTLHIPGKVSTTELYPLYPYFSFLCVDYFSGYMNIF
jgi:hypothetical protein